MNIHRTTAQPEWKKRTPSDYNVFQKLSAATYGVASPANIITIIGLGTVIFGLSLVLQGNFWYGLVSIAIGRLLDVLDGMVAEATHTKSPLGELFDATADKVGTFLTIAVLIFIGTTHWWIIAALIIPQTIIPIIILYKKRQGVSVHPTRLGKLSMATAWIGSIGLLIVKAIDSSPAFTISVYVLIGVSLILGIYASWQYATGRD